MASVSADRSLSYALFVDAMNIHGAGAELVSNAPEDTHAILLVHSLAGHADKALQFAKKVDAARTIPMQFMMDGADVAVSNGMPAAIVRDGYARWADGRDKEPKMPSGLVIPTLLAKSLGLEAAMETDTAIATNSSVPLPEQVARVLLALRDGSQVSALKTD
ncbi:hypothetical protein [Pyruvatibacter sp.]|uniref:hypothetical protein n=1 Tax=Pyruvatibacter sp. TaxID=1981328 RepID=UPI0032638BF9